MLTALDGPHETVEKRFGRIVDAWAEANAGFARHDNTSLPGHECLKDLFTKFVSRIRQGQDKMSTKYPTTEPARPKVLDPQDPLTEETARFYCQSASALVQTDFFDEFDQTPYSKCLAIMSEEDYNWITKLQRRLWRVARYFMHAKFVASRGLDFIRRVLGPDGVERFVKDGEGIEIVWVGDKPGVLPESHGAPHSPLSFLVDAFKKWPAVQPCCPTERHEVMVRESEVLNDIEMAYPKVVNPKIHSEAQMITFLEREKISVHKNIIGVSKLMCWSCDAYAKIANENRREEEKWVLSGTSKKPDCEWLIPLNPLGEAVVSLTQVAFESALIGLIARIDVRPDSDLGSLDWDSGLESD